MKLASIQGLRAVAVLLVVGAHTRGYEIALHSHSFFITFIPVEVSGVDLFFVISGFVMMYVHWNDFAQGASLRFLVKRAFRIFPLYWLLTAVLAVLFTRFPGMVHNWESMHAGLVQSFLLIPQLGLPLLFVGWSLVYEMYFYYLFTVALCVSRSVAAALFALWGVALIGVQFVPLPYTPLIEVLTRNCSIEFLFGIAIAMLAKSMNMRYAVASLVAGTVAFVYFSAVGLGHEEHWIEDSHFRFLMVGLPMALILYSCVALEIRGSLKTPRMLAYIGDASYSIYLSHPLTYAVFARIMTTIAQRHHVPMPLTLGLAYISAVAVGLAMYRFLEAPSMKLLNRLYYRLFPKKKSLPTTEISTGVTAGLLGP